MDMVKVKNRSSSTVVYSIPEDGIRREITPGETREIAVSELEHLTYRPGGKALLQDYLQVEDQAVVDKIALKTEPEYWMSIEDIKKLLISGSLPEFLDCLDFAPQGVIDAVKELAIKLPLNDSAKREALREKTGYDVDKILMNQRAQEQAEKELTGGTDGAAPRRRVEKEAITSTPTGRRSTPNYKVASREGENK